MAPTTDFSKPYATYFNFYRDHLYNFCMNFDDWNFDSLPALDDIYFRKNLITEGYAVLFDFHGELISVDGALSGIDRTYRPTTYTSANHQILGLKRKISYFNDIKPGGACVCYNVLNYSKPKGMYDIIDITAHRLAHIAVSIDTSVKNSRVCIIPVVKDDKQAAKTVRMLQQMYDGEPAVLSYESSFGSDKGVDIFPIKARDNLVVMELYDAKRNILSEFLKYLGVDCLALDKKERTNLAEMNSQNQELKINADIYLKPRQLFCKEVKDTFGVDISVDINKPAVDTLVDAVGLDGTAAGMDENGEKEGVDNEES